MNQENKKELTFWDHLDELRKVIFRILIVVIVVMIIAFVCKETLFNIVLAPQKSDFIIYRLLCKLGEVLSFPSICPEDFQVKLISTQLTSQFFIHMSMAFYAGILLASPYILYQIFRFVSPALYEDERKYSARVIIYSCLLFFAGVLFNYFLIFPLSFRFLGTYQVSPDVPNLITLSSYTDMLLMLSLMMGIMSELPIISWLFAKLGFLTDTFMKKYRRHAVIIILVIAAIITPTTDAFTLFIVSLPIYILYELSIQVVKRTVKKTPRKNKPLLPTNNIIPQKFGEEEWQDPYQNK